MIDPVQSVLNTMSGSYMNRWRLTTEEQGAWRDGLKSFTADTLRSACNRARIDFPEWPPTLMEFRRYCIQDRDKDKEPDKNEDLTTKYNKWARENSLREKLPGESVEEFRCRLVWEFERRKRGVSNEELNQIVRENREGNRRLHGLNHGSLLEAK